MGVLQSTVTSSVANATLGILLKGNHTGNPHKEKKILEMLHLHMGWVQGKILI